MIGFIKKMFSQPAPAAPVQPAPSQPAPAPPKPAPVEVKAAPASSASPAADGETISIPLSAIVAKLPPNLAASPTVSLNGSYALPVKIALAQLPAGAVRIRFGELRQAAPPGTFSADPSQDETMVNLPLQNILTAMGPAMLTRRSGQKQIDVPEDITGVFGGKAHAGGPAPGISKPAPAPAPTPAAPKPAPAPIASAAVIAAAPVAPAPISPATPISPIAPGPSVPAMPKPAPRPPTSIATPTTAAKAPASSPLPFATQKPAVPPSAPAPVGTAAASQAGSGAGKLTLSLASISESWPEAVRQDIAQANLIGASVGLPMARVEAALKTGKIIFKWGELSQWLDAPAATLSSTHQDVTVDLPLKVIAPLFMAQRTSGVSQQKIIIGENIPNLFEGMSKPPAPSAGPEPPTLSSAPTVEAPPAPSAPTPGASAPASILGEIFGQPAKKDWSPQEITQKLNTLPAIAASLIAMSDGLLVAGDLPAPFKSETLAAFLPQIFGRMNHYAAEIQLGQLSVLTLQAGASQCAIFKTGALYLAVLGKPGEKLPDALLHKVAGELTKNSQ